MHGKRFDYLAKTWGLTWGTDGTSRRGVLSLAGPRSAVLGGEGCAPRQVAVAREGRAAWAAALRDSGASTGPASTAATSPAPAPTVAVAGARRRAVRRGPIAPVSELGSGGGYCLAASESTSDGNGCISPGCQHNRDCPTGQVCARVPGCCPDKPRICAIPCPAGELHRRSAASDLHGASHHRSASPRRRDHPGHRQRPGLDRGHPIRQRGHRRPALHRRHHGPGCGDVHGIDQSQPAHVTLTGDRRRRQCDHL